MSLKLLIFIIKWRNFENKIKLYEVRRTQIHNAVHGHTFNWFTYLLTVAPERIWKWGVPVRRKAPENLFLVVLLHFLALWVQLVVFVSAFVMVCTVWSVFCLLFFYSRCPRPRAQPFVKWGARAPVIYGVGATAYLVKSIGNFLIFHEIFQARKIHEIS